MKKKYKLLNLDHEAIEKHVKKRMENKNIIGEK